MEAKADGFFSWDYEVEDGDATVATLRGRWMKRAGEFELGGRTLTMGREDGVFVLRDGEQLLARAGKLNPRQHEFQVEADGDELILRSASMSGREFVVLADGETIGSIRPAAASRRQVHIDLPGLSPELTLFLTLLVLAQWRRPSYLSTPGFVEYEGGVELLAVASDTIEAALIECALESQGIPVTLSGGQASFGFGELPRDAFNVELWVPSARMEEAKRAYREHLRDSSAESQPTGERDPSDQSVDG